MTWKVVIRYDGSPDIISPSKRVIKKNYKSVITGFKTREEAEAYERKLYSMFFI